MSKRYTYLLIFLFLPSVLSAQVSLSLKQCRDLALRNDPYVLNSGLAVKAARAQKQEALAEYFPKVSISSFAFWSLDPMLEIGIKDILGESDFTNNLQAQVNQYASQLGFSPEFTAFKSGVSASVSVVQPVFAGGRIVNGNRLASLGVEVSEIQRDIKLRTTEEAVAESYWQIVALEEKQRTLGHLSEFLDSLYKDVAVAVEAGLALDTDLAQVELKKMELRSGQNSLKNGVRLLKMSLFNSIGQKYAILKAASDSLSPYIDEIVLTDRLKDLEPPQTYYIPEEEMVAGLEEERLLKMSVDAKKLEKKMIMGEALPQIGVGASYGYTHMLNSRFNGQVYAMVQIPISDWGKISRRMERKEYEIDMARNEQEYLSAQLLLQVRQLWLNLNTAWDNMLIAREAADLAETTTLRLQDRYEAGFVPLTEVLQAQSQYRSLEEAYIDAQIEYSSALTSYLLRK